MTAELDLEENVDYDEPNAEILPRNQKLLKKSMLIDGMINLSGKGGRLGVVKLTDKDTKKSIGRIQAKRTDAVSLF